MEVRVAVLWSMVCEEIIDKNTVVLKAIAKSETNGRKN